MEHRSRKASWPLWVAGAVVIVAGVVAFVAILISGLIDVTRDMTRVVVPGASTLDLPEVGTYTIMHEYRSDFGGKTYLQARGSVSFKCRLTSEQGDDVPVRLCSTNSTYSLGSREGYSILEFTIGDPGTYVLETEASDESVLAVSRGFMAGILKTVLGSIGVCSASAIVGLLLLVFALVRTLRNRQVGKAAPTQHPGDSAPGPQWRGPQ